MQSDPARFHSCDPNHAPTSPRFQTVLALPEAALVLYLGPIALSLSGIAPETNQAPFEGQRPIRVCSRPGPFPLLLGVAEMAPYPQPPRLHENAASRRIQRGKSGASSSGHKDGRFIVSSGRPCAYGQTTGKGLPHAQTTDEPS
jgi:hypothetical protein